MKPCLSLPALLVLGCASSAAPPSPAPVDAATVTTPDAAATPDAGATATPDAAPNSAPPGVTIGGTFVPREKAIVLLHIGHSNMAGRTDVPAELRPLSYDTDPHLWAYARGGTWRPAKEPLSGDLITMGRAGPGMSILHAALALAPDDYLVSIGRGQSGSYGGYCRNFRKGGLLYDYVMAPALELRGRVTFGAIFAMFGTSEADDMANAGHFGECMQAVVADMRADLGLPDLPFILGDWEAGATDYVSPTSPVAMVVIPQLRALPTQVTRLALVPTEMLPVVPDDHHYDLTGYKLWGERAVGLLRSNHWAPWLPGP
jgi:hypothetical protein